MHPIDENSPFNSTNEKLLADSNAEILILLSAFDETFSATVHTRTSYKYNEIVWGKKFDFTRQVATEPMFLHGFFRKVRNFLCIYGWCRY
ncbi:MAG: hypothetical protein DWQ05_13095 [Calditrichaeota bacterium]|nr:MAG: hypothetical protein DWQ05_13095 [Calditrichota bacterium]